VQLARPILVQIWQRGASLLMGAGVYARGSFVGTVAGHPCLFLLSACACLFGVRMQSIKQGPAFSPDRWDVACRLSPQALLALLVPPRFAPQPPGGDCLSYVRTLYKLRPLVEDLMMEWMLWRLKSANSSRSGFPIGFAITFLGGACEQCSFVRHCPCHVWYTP